MTSVTVSRTRRAWLACWFIAVPVGFGLISLSIGQDANWDLRNYHLYNPWALLTGRLGIDVAPAETPGYFNPLLDLPYWFLTRHAPPRVVAFLFGALHGLDILVLYRIGLVLLDGEQRHATAVLLALVAGTDNAFTAELGNTMGDDTTALLMLGGLAIAVAAVVRTRVVPARSLACAGLLIGFGTGLKLTNASYAVALCAAALATPRAWRDRRVALTAAAVGIAAGIVLTYGYWFATLWSHFRNPFYPQFNGLFRSPLAALTMVVDDRWGPSGWFEVLAFPVAFTVFPIRIFEIPLVNLLWPVAYLLFLAWAGVRGWRSMRGRASSIDDAPDDASAARRFLLAFVAAAFLVWMMVFSIGRYLIPLNLLLPLVVWLLLHRLWQPRTARALGCMLLACALVPLLFNSRNWGAADFGDTAYRVDPPAIPQPSRTTILVMTAPVTWMFPYFPAELAYVSFAGTFPESPAHRARIASVLAARAGPVYALLAADTGSEGTERGRLNRFFARWDVRKGDLPCRYAIRSFAESPGNDIVFDGAADAPASTPCRIGSDPARRKALLRDAAAVAGDLRRMGWSVDLARCTIHRAWIGAEPYDYRFCPVERVAAAD